MSTKPTKTKPETPTIAVAVKSFGNSKSFEGLRVKAGQRFAIDKPQGGLPVMSMARFNSLKNTGLVRALGDLDKMAAPEKLAFRSHVQYAHQGEAMAKAAAEGEGKSLTKRKATGAPAKAGQKPAARASIRTASKKRTQVENPAAPSLITGQANPTGSQTGGETSESSSPAARPVTSSSFQKRGNRRA